MSAAPAGRPVLACGGPAGAGIERLLRHFGLAVVRLPADADIPGSYWGPPEAGLVGSTLYLRPDTPVHSALHEACHYVCMDPARRAHLDTDAGGDDLEEAAVCYLQVLLADRLPQLGRERLFADMDAWGYSFRLGSARGWFEADAEDARCWLLAQGLLDPNGAPVFRLRGEPRGARAPRGQGVTRAVSRSRPAPRPTPAPWLREEPASDSPVPASPSGTRRARPDRGPD